MDDETYALVRNALAWATSHLRKDAARDADRRAAYMPVWGESTRRTSYGTEAENAFAACERALKALEQTEEAKAHRAKQEAARRAKRT